MIRRRGVARHPMIPRLNREGRRPTPGPARPVGAVGAATPSGIRVAAVTAVLAAASVAAVLGAAGCARDRPQLSGFAFGDLRIVSVGDIVELRTPVRSDGVREWRVVSYDSYYLELIDNPKAVRRADDRLEMLTRARARAAGETEVVLAERNPADGTPRIVRFDVRIND